MENKKILIGLGILIAVVLFTTLGSSSAYSQAAPAAVQFVVNDELKECKTFWAGDEFIRYRLPEGWRQYGLSVHDFDNLTEACSEIGYTYTGELKVEGDRVGPYYGESYLMFYLEKYYLVILFLAILILVSIIIIYKNVIK